MVGKDLRSQNHTVPAYEVEDMVPLLQLHTVDPYGACRNRETPMTFWCNSKIRGGNFHLGPRLVAGSRTCQVRGQNLGVEVGRKDRDGVGLSVLE